MYRHTLKSKTSGAPLAAALLHSRATAEASAPATQKLLVPLDGSFEAEAALVHVVKTSQSVGVTVHLLNVQTQIHAGDVNLFNSAALIEEQRRAAGEQITMRAKRALDSYGIAYTTEIAFGEPAEEIVRHAEAHRCDKIVMATTRRGLIKRLLHRSVVQRVVKRAGVPVTIVKSRTERTSPALCLSLNGLFEPVGAHGNTGAKTMHTAIG